MNLEGKETWWVPTLGAGAEPIMEFADDDRSSLEGVERTVLWRRYKRQIHLMRKVGVCPEVKAAVATSLEELVRNFAEARQNYVDYVNHRRPVLVQVEWKGEAQTMVQDGWITDTRGLAPIYTKLS